MQQRPTVADKTHRPLHANGASRPGMRSYQCARRRRGATERRWCMVGSQALMPLEDSHACRVRTSKQADDVGGFRCPTTPKFSPNERAQRLMVGKITKSGHSGSPSPLSLDVLVTPVAPTHVFTLSCINLPDERKQCSAPSIAAAIHGRWS